MDIDTRTCQRDQENEHTTGAYTDSFYTYSKAQETSEAGNGSHHEPKQSRKQSNQRY